MAVEVQKFEDFKWLKASYVPVLKQLQDSEILAIMMTVGLQSNLSGLFSIDLNGNVNGAVETCMETFHSLVEEEECDWHLSLLARKAVHFSLINLIWKSSSSLPWKLQILRSSLYNFKEVEHGWKTGSASLSSSEKQVSDSAN
ncbi:hypothetical protein DITRI_Ditri02bG0119600 [Diplodiscus trichospermus]